LSLKDFLEQAFGPWSFVSSLIKDDDMVPPSQADSERQSMLCQLSRFAKSASERIEVLSYLYIVLEVYTTSVRF
jgi:hypothetical protein